MVGIEGRRRGEPAKYGKTPNQVKTELRLLKWAAFVFSFIIFVSFCSI